MDIFDKPTLKSSLIFISTYVISANIGSTLSEKMNVNYLGEIILLLALSVFLIIYVKKNKLTKDIGLTKISFYEIKNNLLYLPLFIMVLANGVFFFDRTITFKNIVLSIVFMILVAFLEELLFRGLLFKSIKANNTTKAAIFISGSTFGFGHIINLLNGYTIINQIIQIVMATLIGIILSVLFVRTKSIIPGMIFHFFFNIASTLSIEVAPLYDYISASIIFVIDLIYLFYLLKCMQQNEEIYDKHNHKV